MIFKNRHDDHEPFSISNWITRPFRAIGELTSGGDGIQSEQSAVQRLLSLVFFPLTLLGSFLSFMVQSWATNRSGSAFILGVPAIVSMTGLLAGIWLAGYLKEGRSVAASQAYLQFHLDLGNLESAEMFARKLVELKPEDDSLKYQLALIREQNDKLPEATELMHYIAPDERPRYSNAHVWRSLQAMKNLSDSEDPLGVETEITKHLDFALSIDPDNQRAKVGKADYYLAKAADAAKAAEPAEAGEETEETEEEKFRKLAMRELADVVSVNDDEPMTMLQLRSIPLFMQLFSEFNDARIVNLKFEGMMDDFGPMIRRNPNLFPVWSTVINTAATLKRYGDVDDTLRNAEQLITDPIVARQLSALASNVLLEQARDFSELENRDQYRRRLNAILVSLRINARNRVAYKMLTNFAARKTNPDFNESWLRDSIINSADHSAVHILIGMDDIGQGNIEDGKARWRLAGSNMGDPALAQLKMGYLINSAMVDYPEDFPEVIDMLTLAIELYPEQPIFYRLRGMYYKNQNRYLDAANDFEEAVKKMADDFELRKYLIDCYQSLGQPELALDHQLELDRILSSVDTKQRNQILEALERL